MQTHGICPNKNVNMGTCHDDAGWIRHVMRKRCTLCPPIVPLLWLLVSSISHPKHFLLGHVYKWMMHSKMYMIIIPKLNYIYRYVWWNFSLIIQTLSTGVISRHNFISALLLTFFNAICLYMNNLHVELSFLQLYEAFTNTGTHTCTLHVHVHCTVHVIAPFTWLMK